MSSSNSCSCKCGSIICHNVHLHKFNSDIFKSPEFDDCVFSILHHRSLRVKNAESVIVDKCCNNSLFFHCPHCQDEFSITIHKGKKTHFVLGFSGENLTNIDPIKHHILVSIPEFPKVLKTYVSLIDEPPIKDNNQKGQHKIPSTHDYDVLTTSFSTDQSEDEIFADDNSDEEIMFGTANNYVVIGKYHDWSLRTSLL